MKTINKLKRYCNQMLFDYTIVDDVLTVDGVNYFIIDEDQTLFDEDLNFMPAVLDDHEYVIFNFCGRFYTHKVGEDVEMKEFKYVGKAKQNLETKSFLGIHSGQELMNGMSLYKDWIKKAKFLGVETLGICEHKTLRGALLFQIECKKNGIKSILGLSIPVEHKGEEFNVKLYAQNFQGWLNLLKFNSIVNVEGKVFVGLQDLKDNLEGLFLVVDPKTTPFEIALNDLPTDFYQLETVEFINESEDQEFLKNFEKYIKSELEPISITDAYYLEAEDYEIREIVWTMNKTFDVRTRNQYFKNKDQYAKEFISLFEDGNQDHYVRLYKQAITNENYLISKCNFQYDTDTRHLPRYVMTEEEANEYETNEDLFIGLVKKGFSEKNITDPQKYIDRLKVEIEVLKQGDVVDYFLALHDIIRYAKSEGMITGIGRGSAGGSLVAYLLDIIKVDPLEFDLFFERFLNSGRMGEYQDRPSFTFVGEDGKEIVIAEGSIVKVMRNGKEKNLFVQEVAEGDEILIY